MVKKPNKGQEGAQSRRIIGTLEESLSIQLSIVGRISDSLSDIAKQLSQDEKTQKAWGRTGQLIQIGTLKLSAALTSFISESFKLQKESLVINKTFGQAVESTTGKLEGVAGGLTAVQTALKFETEGLAFVGKGSIALGARMQLLGQNLTTLTGLNKQLLILGHFSRDQVESLNTTLHSLSVSYGVSTEKLITSIDGLKESLPILGLARVGDEVSNALGELTAKFPALDKNLSQFVNALAGPEADIGMLSVIGAIEGAEKLTSGQVTSWKQLQSIIKSVANTSESIIGDFRSLPLVAKQQLLKVIGPGGQLAIQLRDAMNQVDPRGQGPTMDQLLQDAMIAFKTFMAPIAVSLGKIATTLAPLVAVIGKVFSFLEKFKIVTGSIIAFFGIKYLKPVWTSILGLKASIEKQSAQLAAMHAKGSLIGPARSKYMFPLAKSNILRTLGPQIALLAGGMVISKIVSSFAEAQSLNAQALDKLAEAELVRARSEAESNRALFGSSRFEVLSQQLIKDSILRVATREAVLIDALDTLGARIVTAVDGTTTAVFDTGVPTVSLSRGI